MGSTKDGVKSNGGHKKKRERKADDAAKTGDGHAELSEKTHSQPDEQPQTTQDGGDAGRPKAKAKADAEGQASTPALVANDGVEAAAPNERRDGKADDGAKRHEAPTEVTKSAEPSIVSSIPEAPVTVERKPFQQADDEQLPQAGTARANVAASRQRSKGTTEDGWAERHQNQTVLQQHVDFFDQDHDGIIWPVDTFNGFHALGYGVVFSLLAAIIINGAFSYPTLSGWLPDPLFRIHMGNIHKDKHGSDSGAYDNEGRFVPQKFEEIFSKYAEGRDYVTAEDVLRFLGGQRLFGDVFGWLGAAFEWLATYLLLWPADGRMAKEDIRRVYDGSIFYAIATRRQKANNE